MNNITKTKLASNGKKCDMCDKPCIIYYTKTCDNKFLCAECSKKAGIPLIRNVDDVYPSFEELKKRIAEREEALCKAKKRMRKNKNTKTVTITKTIKTVKITKTADF